VDVENIPQGLDNQHVKELGERGFLKTSNCASITHDGVMTRQFQSTPSGHTGPPEEIKVK